MIKDNAKKYVALNNISIAEALSKIDENGKGILFIVDDIGELEGSATDGDIRRWLLKTGDLHATISAAMNRHPKKLFTNDRKTAKVFLEEQHITAVPIVNTNNVLEDVVFATDLANEHHDYKKHTLENVPVIVMAGGKGTRLYPYTKVLPKPLIPIGDIPILERILNCFYEYGMDTYYMTVNYKKGMIKSYFSDLEPAYNIHYVEEEKPLGTAGSITLIDKDFDQPVFITNCDSLILADYADIYRHHKEAGNVMTVVSALKNVVVPYGVLHSHQNGVITELEEKPCLSYFINTGMYIVNPEAIKEIPKDTFFHMTDLIETLMQQGKQVGMYPISEDSFLDMGEFEEMKRMEEKLKV